MIQILRLARCFMCCKFFHADLSSSVFIQPLLLVGCAQKTQGIDALNRKLKPEYTKVCTFSSARIQNALCNIKLLMYIRCCSFLNLLLLRAVSGVRIEVTHRGDESRKYRIAGL